MIEIINENTEAITEVKMIDMDKKGKSVTHLTVGDIRRMDLWDEDHIVIVDSNGNIKDVSKILADVDYGYLYLQ